MPCHRARRCGRRALSDGDSKGAAVDVEHLTWRPYGRVRPVLPDLSLSIAPGERVLLVGPSGSGKSTLLRAIAGLLLTADSGELAGSVRIDGAAPDAETGAVGLVLQDPGVAAVASTVGRDVAFGLENLGMPRAAIAAPVAAALAEVRLGGLADASPLTLSGGEQQRLALAGALVMSPRVLLLDEPTAMLDPANAASVRSVVGQVVQARGLTTVVVEHRLEPWLDQVDRLLVLDDAGSIVADGEPGRILHGYGDALVAQGIWVPGYPDPEPLTLDLGGGAGHGTVERTRGLTVRLTTRPLNAPTRETTAVDDASLDLDAGRTVALVGPSGSGKSTLLEALAGLVAPSAGAVDLATRRDPHTWSSPDLAATVAWVPQRAASTLIGSTVRDDVLLTAHAVGMPGVEAEARADLLLDRLGLAHLATADPRHLSGGEQRRLAVASAVLHQPEVLLADEPTIGQDRLTWSAVLGVLEASRRAGSAVLVATHDEALTARADHVLRMPAKPATTAVGVPARQALAARCGPLALVLACLLVLPLPAFVSSWRASAVVLATEVLLGVLALAAPGRGPAIPGRYRRAGLRLVPALVAVLGVGWSTWLLGGHNVEVAVGAALRVLSLLLPSVALLPFVDPDALGDHLAQRLHLPARPVVAATAALQRFQTFSALWTQVTRARRVRGVGPGSSVVARVRAAAQTTLAVFVAVLGQASVLALAMDARGFAGAYRRTWAGPAPWRTADTVVVLGGVVVLLIGILAGRLVG